MELELEMARLVKEYLVEYKLGGHDTYIYCS